MRQKYTKRQIEKQILTETDTQTERDRNRYRNTARDRDSNNKQGEECENKYQCNIQIESCFRISKQNDYNYYNNS